VQFHGLGVTPIRRKPGVDARGTAAPGRLSDRSSVSSGGVVAQAAQAGGSAQSDAHRGGGSKKGGGAHLAAAALGVLAGIGGFIDTGGVLTAVQAGSKYHYALVWTVVFGFIGFSVFAEMSGRISVSSGQPTYEVIRTTLGPKLGAIPVIVNVVTHVLVLAVDIAGMSLALQLLTGIDYRIWAPIAAFGLAAALWRLGFEKVDTTAAILGLTMLIAVAAMIKLGPDWGSLFSQLVKPRVDDVESMPKYLFAVASMIGAFMTPYQFDFYSSGAVEQRWGGRQLLQNRAVAILGTLFGAFVTFSLIGAAGTASPLGGPVETIRAAAHPAMQAFGKAGFYVFVVGVLCVSVAASVELCLSGGYSVCQYYGWDWGKTGPPVQAPAFNLVFLGMIALAALIVVAGVDVIKFNNITMAIASAALPFTFVPLLVVANDEQFMGEQRNRWSVNVVAVMLLSVLVCITLAVPALLLLTHGEF
jgi:manganese transport protein